MKKIEKHCAAPDISDGVLDGESLISRLVLLVVAGAKSPLRRRVRSVVSMPIISRSDGRSVSDYWIGYREGRKKLGNRCRHGCERSKVDVLRRKEALLRDRAGRSDRFGKHERTTKLRFRISLTRSETRHGIIRSALFIS